MTPDAQGRFCAHCQKSVIDFTTWNDADLYAFFSKNSQSVCGRLQSQQLNRTIQLPVQKPTRLYRIAIAWGLSLMFTQLPATHARPKPPLMEQDMLAQQDLPQNDSMGNDSLVIRGMVQGYKRPSSERTLIYARLRGQYLNYTYDDTSGRFELIINRQLSPSDTITIESHSPGYSARTLKWSTSTKEEVIIKLEIIVPYCTITQGDVASGPLNIGIERSRIIEPPEHIPELSPDQIKRLANSSKH